MKRRIPEIIGLVIILASAAGWFIVTGTPNDKTEKSAPIEVREEVEPTLLYGIPMDEYEVIEGVIGRNELIGNILNSHGVTRQEIYRISNLPKEKLDVRKIRPDNKYALFLDSTGVKYFVYEKDIVEYAVVHLSDSVFVEVESKDVEHRITEFEGEITSSLWNAFEDAGSNPLLANKLSDIYAWSIDFFGLQEGDKFRLIYEEDFVDTISVGIRNIDAAWFYHAGHEFWAIPFEQDSVVSFFDEEGNSLRKAFLKAPLNYSRISSGFSNSRMHPILKIRRPHHGVDYAAPLGTPVQAIGDGQIIARAYQKGGGNYVKIKHNGIYTTVYMHLSKFGPGIKQGVYVKQGDIIGYVGSTGLSTGPHLDFRFFKNGRAVNPLTVEAPPVEPIHEENIADFELVKRSVMGYLQ